jgi:hypothetical protein
MAHTVNVSRLFQYREANAPRTLARTKTAIDALVAVIAFCDWFAAGDTEQCGMLGLLVVVIHRKFSSYAFHREKFCGGWRPF